MNIELRGCKAAVTGYTAGAGPAGAERLARAGASAAVCWEQASGTTSAALRAAIGVPQPTA